MKTRMKTRPAPLVALYARTAGDLMTANPVSIREAATTREAALFLSSRGISAAPVVDEAGRPVGVVSRSDLLSHRAHRDLHLHHEASDGATLADGSDDRARVREVMTPAVFCVRPETPAGKVVEKMLALRVRRLFVVDPQQGGALVGVISAFDVLRSLRPQCPCERQHPGQGDSPEAAESERATGTVEEGWVVTG